MAGMSEGLSGTFVAPLIGAQVLAGKASRFIDARGSCLRLLGDEDPFQNATLVNSKMPRR